MAVAITKSTTINAPFERVLEVIRDLENEPTWWPGMLSATTLTSDDQGRPTRGKLVNEVAKIGKDEFELDFVQRDDGMTWSLSKPTSMQKGQRGEWTLVDKGGSTEATLFLELDANIPVPGFLQKKIIEGQVKGVLAALQKTCQA
ncbi:SRPBCC family protein [Calidifontibacter terrae]